MLKSKIYFQKYFTDPSKGVLLLCIIFFLFMYPVCHAYLSVHCSLVVTCLESTGLLALLYIMLYCVFVTFLYGVMGQVWYLIVSIPYLCFLLTLSYGLCVCTDDNPLRIFAKLKRIPDATM